MTLNTVTVKNILLLVNFIFAVLGLILISLGIFILVSASTNLVDHGENFAGGLIIALGIIILLIAIFGCLAVIHEARRRVLIYVVIVVVLILCQLLMAGMASQGTRDGLAGSVQNGFEELWEIEKKETGALAYYEDWLQCCGVNNTADYRLINHNIPKSCCKEHNCSRQENIYKEGCQSKFEEYLADKMLFFSIVCWIIILVEIAGAVFGWILYRRFKNDSRRLNAAWM